MSGKERQAKWRERVKADRDSYEAYLKKERDRKAAQRSAARTKMSEEQEQEYLKKERHRIQEYRAKKKLMNCQGSESDASPYRTTQAKGKAVKRVQHALPSSPRKRLCVIESIAKDAGIEIPTASIRSSRSYNALSEETKDKVINFYNTNDISWQAPGCKDRVIIREVDSEGKRVKRTEQVRYMLVSLKEAHSSFVKAHQEYKIGLSKFCELRPVNIKLFDHIPHNVCVCSYHENVRLLLLCLKEHSELCTDFQGFINQITCSSTQKSCMSNECSECKHKIDNFAPKEPGDLIKYHQWLTHDKVEKVEIQGTVGDAFTLLKQQLRTFLIHTHVKRKQAAHLNSLVSQCDTKHVVLQVDFSENATIVSQNEVQSAHWCHGQATLFTAHAWIEEEKTENIVLISDDLNHTKYSIYVYMVHIMELLKRKYPSIEV